MPQAAACAAVFEDDTETEGKARGKADFIDVVLHPTSKAVSRWSLAKQMSYLIVCVTLAQ